MPDLDSAVVEVDLTEETPTPDPADDTTPPPDDAPEEAPAPPNLITGIDWGQDGDTSVTLVRQGDRVMTLEAFAAESDENLSLIERAMNKARLLLGLQETQKARIVGIDHVMQHGGIKSIGDGLFVACFTNNFTDRDGETIKGAALERMVKRVRAKLVPYPELWFRHKWYMKHGELFFVNTAKSQSGVVMCYGVGRFDKSPLGGMMEKFYARNPGRYAMSHGFEFDDSAFDPVTKTYSEINTFEVSALLPDTAANFFTPFKTLRELNMSHVLSESDRKELLAEGLPPGIVDAVAKDHARFAKSAEAVKQRLNTAFKDVTVIPPAPVAAKLDTPTPAPEDDEEAPAEDAPETEGKADMAAIGALLGELVSAQADMQELSAAMVDRIFAQDAIIADLQAANGIETVPASEAVETEIAAAAASVNGTGITSPTLQRLQRAQTAVGGKRVSGAHADNPYADVPALGGLFRDD